MIDFRMPSLGADMDQGILVGWLVSPGDPVHRGQVIAEVESDKGIIEVECWDEGVVDELLVSPGPTRLVVGTPLARLRPRDEATAPEPAPPSPDEATAREPAPPSRTVEGAAPVPEPGIRHRPPGRRPTPPVRHLAHRLGVDLDTVVPTGKDGGLTRADVLGAAAAYARPKATPMARRLARERAVALGSVVPSRADGIITTEDLAAVEAVEQPAPSAEPPAPRRDAGTADTGAAMRAAIARSMARSKREIPHYYLATHIDLDNAVRWLEEQNDERPITRRLLPAVLLLKATALALHEVPELNGHWTEGAFHPEAAIHVGVAVSLRGGGLVAPAIHDADTLDLDQLMEALRDLVGRARTSHIRSSEMSDPTITVTNLGDRGVETAFPVIIPPQVAIVGFGKVSRQPVVADGMIGSHPVVHATLAADHRVTDGHRGGLFLESLDHLLQEPERL